MMAFWDLNFRKKPTNKSLTESDSRLTNNTVFKYFNAPALWVCNYYFSISTSEKNYIALFGVKI